MKIAFTTSGDGLDGPLDPRFGRAPKFLIHDPASGSVTIVDNAPNLHAAQGAGIQSAETVARQGVAVLVTGHCGPKAFRVLAAAKIKVYPCAAATVRQALSLYNEGKLTEAAAADVEGHW
jgi:predicted Fe-Mo cluster-binding NifX family protein